MGENNTICVGIDIGDRYCQIAVLDEEGAPKRSPKHRISKIFGINRPRPFSVRG